MPMEIDCPECRGKGKIQKHYIADPERYYELCRYPGCDLGEVTVYTAKEMKEAVEAERDRIIDKILTKEGILLIAKMIKETLLLQSLSEPIQDAEPIRSRGEN